METGLKFYDIHEAAKIVHLHPESLRRECRLGKINFFRSGWRFLFSEKQLMDFLSIRASSSVRRQRLRKLAAA